MFAACTIGMVIGLYFGAVSAFSLLPDLEQGILSFKTVAGWFLVFLVVPTIVGAVALRWMWVCRPLD